MTDSYDAAAVSLITHGYALLKIDDALRPVVHQAFYEARAFFSRDNQAKLATADLSRLEGYRPMGAEFSEHPNEIDLCEYFSVWHWNQSEAKANAWISQNTLHATLTSALHDFANVADGVLEALRCRLNPKAQKVDVAQASYLQMNHYRPRDFEREFLQGAHEDGHVLTIHKATGRGLEVQLDGCFSGLDIAEDEFLLLPGSLLTLITGSSIAPLFHRVRNDRSSADRLALLYFVNPSMTLETQPWLASKINQGVSIREIARSCIGAR
jgi:isopenicillin N synthase-like dioxygenase